MRYRKKNWTGKGQSRFHGKLHFLINQYNKKVHILGLSNTGYEISIMIFRIKKQLM